MNDALRADLIKLLNECKREHYTDYAGVNDCDAEFGNYECTCGADELNAKIDVMIGRLRG